MTLAEKIKYLRKRMGITQDMLAQLSDVHPVSIRKYETNKMIPQPAQLERIAKALGVSYNALNDLDNAGLRLQTVGDLMGILFVLFNTGILQMTGERGKNNRYKPETVRISVNPMLAPFIEVKRITQTIDNSFSLNDLLLHIKDEQVFSDLLRWEQVCRTCEIFKKFAGDLPTTEHQIAYTDMLDTKEKIELELQRSQTTL